MRPTLSIITITFNDPIGFRRTAASVKDHLSSRIEWIVKDGASERCLVNEITQLTSIPHCVFESSPDKGIYNAMNRALSLATGDWVYL